MYYDTSIKLSRAVLAASGCPLFNTYLLICGTELSNPAIRVENEYIEQTITIIIGKSLKGNVL